LIKLGKPVTDPVLLALFLTPFLRAVPPQHPFLGKREKYLYWVQSVHWTVHEIFTPFSYPRGAREMACQILVAQSHLKRSLQQGVVSKKLRMKRYFKEAVFLFGIEAQARGEKIPRLLQNAAPPDLLPWWPKELKRKRRRSGKRPFPISSINWEARSQVPEKGTTAPHKPQD
jgi:hypothetical protein